MDLTATTSPPSICSGSFVYIIRMYVKTSTAILNANIKHGTSLGKHDEQPM